MTRLQEALFALRDAKYAEFQAKLAPTLPKGGFIGVRLPALRQLAKAFAKTPECAAFLETLPHTYYDENLLHAIWLESGRDFDEKLVQVERFLPFVDNWAVCDTLRPRVFARHRDALLPYVERWIVSPETYTSRFCMDMLMTHYLDDAFRPELLALPLTATNEDYYVRMMAAWYYATALAKQWDAAVPYLEQRKMGVWVHNKTIQKACESCRITDAQKTYLRTLKIAASEGEREC